MGLTFQQKFYAIGDEVFVVLDKHYEGFSYVIGMVEIPDDYDEALDIEHRLARQGYVVQRLNFDEVILNGYDLLRR